jgi:hypothetical protein
VYTAVVLYSKSKKVVLYTHSVQYTRTLCMYCILYTVYRPIILYQVYHNKKHCAIMISQSKLSKSHTFMNLPYIVIYCITCCWTPLISSSVTLREDLVPCHLNLPVFPQVNRPTEIGPDGAIPRVIYRAVEDLVSVTSAVRENFNSLMESNPEWKHLIYGNVS